MRHGRFGWPVIVAASAFAVGLILLADAGLPLRPIAVIWFLAVGPGMAFVPLLPTRDGLTAFTIGVGVSLAIDAAVAQAMVYTRHWSAPWSLAILVAIAATGATWQALRGATTGDIEMLRSHGSPAEAPRRDRNHARGDRVDGYDEEVPHVSRSYTDVSRLPSPAALLARAQKFGKVPHPKRRQAVTSQYRSRPLGSGEDPALFPADRSLGMNVASGVTGVPHVRGQ